MQKQDQELEGGLELDSKKMGYYLNGKEKQGENSRQYRQGHRGGNWQIVCAPKRSQWKISTTVKASTLSLLFPAIPRCLEQCLAHWRHLLLALWMTEYTATFKKLQQNTEGLVSGPFSLEQREAGHASGVPEISLEVVGDRWQAPPEWVTNCASSWYVEVLS